MPDIAWISKEAVQIHAYFESVFYLFVTTLLVLGVVIEFFRLPLGATPSVTVLAGRVLIAAILLHTYPEVSSTIADITDSASQRLGGFNQIENVLDKMGDKLQTFSWNWISVKGSLLLAISFLGFFLLYFTVYVAQAFLLYTWVLLYVFSPILIALFTLPRTAIATAALYRALIEASLWKIVWAVLATLLWSSGTGGLGESQELLPALCFNLILAGSLVLTPFVVHALAGKGITSMAGTFGTVAVGGLATVTPASVISTGLKVGKIAYNRSLNTAGRIIKNRFPRAHRAVEAVPRFRQKPSPPTFIKKKSKKNKENL